MIKSIVVHDIPIDAVPGMERWYHRDHSAEIARRYGPWPARHESFSERPNDEFLRDLRSYTP